MDPQTLSAMQSETWRFDRSVSIPMIGALAMQLVVGTWFAAHEDARITDHDRRIVKLEVFVEDRSRIRDEQNEKLVAAIGEVKEKISGLTATMDAIVRKTERR